YTSKSVTYNGGSGSAYRVTQVSRCQANATCANTADEIRTTVAYGTGPGLLPTSATTQSGDGALAATAAYTYTAVGDVQTVDGPLSGTADTTWFAYNADRRLIGAIGPAPGNG